MRPRLHSTGRLTVGCRTHSTCRFLAAGRTCCSWPSTWRAWPARPDQPARAARCCRRQCCVQWVYPASAVTLAYGRVVAVPENHAALLAIQQVLGAICERRPHHAPSSLFLHGPPGCGKSLLVKTLIDNVLRAVPRASVQVLVAGELSR